MISMEPHSQASQRGFECQRSSNNRKNPRQVPVNEAGGIGGPVIIPRA
jgi:hypothetical protein